MTTAKKKAAPKRKRVANPKPPGRKPHDATPERRAEVKALAAFGTPQEEIAPYIGIDLKTLRKYYRAELDDSRLQVNARVSNFLARAATGAALKDPESGATFRDCLTAAIFYGKTRMNMSEKQTLDHTSSDGSLTPTRIEIVSPSADRED